MALAVSIGMTASQGALFSALYNISSGIGRIGFGYLADMFVGVSAIVEKPWCLEGFR